MAFTLRTFQAALLTCMLLYGAADEITTCSSQQLPATNIINSLSFRLEQMLDTQDNYFFSPFSISVALAMVYIGARGTTKEQMSEALDYNIVGKNCLPNKVSESFKELVQSLENDGDDYKLFVANGAFIQRGYRISHYYSFNLEKHFKSKIQFLDFQREDIAAMKTINEWVNTYTKGKITQLLSEPLNPLTMLVLVNAVYFKGLWDLPFDEEDTRDGIFYGINNNEKTVSFMMMQNEIYNYHDKEKNYFIIELEYLSSNVSMIVILPSDKAVFPQYELTNELLCKLRGKFEYTEVTVLLPKFKMEFKRELSKDMIKMGMPELFSDKADLTGISERNDLHVSLMVHKAIIEVNEKGSEASAVLGVEIDGRKRLSKENLFLANHPFLFYVIHKKTNTILFSGRVVDP